MTDADRVPAPAKRTDIGDRRLLVWEPAAAGAWIEGEPMEARR